MQKSISNKFDNPRLWRNPKTIMEAVKTPYSNFLQKILATKYHLTKHAQVFVHIIIFTWFPIIGGGWRRRNNRTDVSNAISGLNAIRMAGEGCQGVLPLPDSGLTHTDVYLYSGRRYIHADGQSDLTRKPRTRQYATGSNLGKRGRNPLSRY